MCVSAEPKRFWERRTDMRRYITRRVVPCLVLLALASLLIPAAVGLAQGGQEMKVEAGFDGLFKAETWLPVRVTVSNEGAALDARVQCRLRQGSPSSDVFSVPVSLPSHSRKELTLYLPADFAQRRTVVELVAGGVTLLEEGVNLSVLPSDALLWGLVSGDSSQFQYLNGLGVDPKRRLYLAYLSPSDLPEQALPWASLDALVFDDADTAQLTQEQREALAAWIASGGHLIVAGGPNGERTAAGLGDLLPVKVGGSRSLESVSALDDYVGLSAEDKGPYIVSLATVTGGSVLVKQGDVPLLVRRLYGRGKVDYLALDLAMAPLAGNLKIWQKIVQPTDASPMMGLSRNSWSSLYQALSRIAALGLPNPGQLTLYLIAYIVCIGPANYLLLRRFKRPEWAWITIPLVALLFSGLGYLGGFHSRGERVITRQMLVYYAQAGAPLASIDAFVGVYSPYRTTYELQLPDGSLAQGLESSGDGLYFSQGQAPTVEGLKAEIGGMPALAVRTTGPAPDVSADLRLRTNTVEGDITNNTGEPLDDCLFMKKTASAWLGTVGPGRNGVRETFTTGTFPASRFSRDSSSELEILARSDVLRTVYQYVRSGEPADLYLVCWQKRPPLKINVKGYSVEAQADAVFVVWLPVEQQ